MKEYEENLNPYSGAERLSEQNTDNKVERVSKTLLITSSTEAVMKAAAGLQTPASGV